MVPRKKACRLFSFDVFWLGHFSKNSTEKNPLLPSVAATYKYFCKRCNIALGTLIVLRDVTVFRSYTGGSGFECHLLLSLDVTSMEFFRIIFLKKWYFWFFDTLYYIPNNFGSVCNVAYPQWNQDTPLYPW